MVSRRSILLWIVIFATLTITATLLTMGSDGPSITGTMRSAWWQLLETVGVTATDRTLDALVAIAPAAAAIFVTMTLTLNLWLAAKITATSGRLHRPWPDLRSAALPPLTLAALCVAIAFCFSGGLLAILAQIVTAALLIAYALTGFAVLHTLTLALKNRALWLTCTYASLQRNHLIPIKRRTNMEVILLERVAKLGHMGEVVRVRDGFARC